MTAPQELDRIIDDQWNGNPTVPDSDESAITGDLIALAQHFELDPHFDSALARQFNTPTRRNIRPRWQRTVAAVAAIIFGLIFVTLSVPQFRAFAQDIIDELFPRSEETERTIEYIPFDRDDFESFDTLDTLQDAVAFEIGLPDIGDQYVFKFSTVIVPRNTIMMIFSPPDSDFPNYRVMQQPLVDATSSGIFWFGEEDNLIGPEAEIIEVSIANYTGEFVQGNWFTPASTHQNEPSVYRWNSDVPIYNLRWQDETFLYEIKLVDTDFTGIEDLVAIAESMMQD